MRCFITPVPLSPILGAVVVVTKENQGADELRFAAYASVITKNSNPAAVAFRPVRRAGTPAVLRNHNRFVRKRSMNFFQVATQVFRGARIPTLVVLVPLNEVHQFGHIVGGISL